MYSLVCLLIMHLSEDIHVCAFVHACIMYYRGRARVCFAHLQSNGADLALVSQNCCVPLLVCPVFPRQFRCITSVCLTYLSTPVYFLEKSAACGVSLSGREGRPRFLVGGRPVTLRFTCTPSLVASSSLFMCARQPDERGFMSADGSHRSLRAMYTACDVSECIHRP